MKTRLLCFLGILVGSLPVPAADKFDASDEAAIRQVIAHWDKIWHGGEAADVARDYADDADWMNAFGVYKRGGAEILAFFVPFGKMNRDTAVKDLKIRYVRPDVAAVWEYYETAGRRTTSGNVYPPRKTHSLRVLAKNNGRWTIVSHLIMDEKERQP